MAPASSIKNIIQSSLEILLPLQVSLFAGCECSGFFMLLTSLDPGPQGR